MSISRRISISWLSLPASEPTSTLVLTSRKLKRFVDLRILPEPGLAQLYWGISGTSSSPTPTSGKWTHEIDSRSNARPGELVDTGEMRKLDNGDILETGEMLDFDDGMVKTYEEVWRDEDTRPGVAVVMELVGDVERAGLVVRVGKWAQGIVKILTTGVTVTERWRHDEDNVRGVQKLVGRWACGRGGEPSSPDMEDVYMPCGDVVWGGELQEDEVVNGWKVLEWSTW